MTLSNPITDTLSEFTVKDLPYVVWKNIHEIDQCIQGELDLDLFVPLSNKSLAHNILRSKQWIRLSSTVLNYPYIEHYYTSSNSRIFHIHLYFKIVTGDSWAKQYILPIDQFLIYGRVLHDFYPIYIANPNASYSLYNFRKNIKLSTITGCLLYKMQREDYNKELLDIYERKNTFRDDTGLIFPIKVIVPRSSGFLSQARATLMQRYCSWSYRRISIVEEMITYLYSLVKRIFCKLFQIPGKKMPGGGVIFAISGPDASGKTTAIKFIHDQYCRHLLARRVHMGRLLSPRLQFYLTALFKFFSSPKSKKIEEASSILNNGIASASYLDMIKAVVVGLVRYIKAHRCLKLSQKGYLVICDRWPSSRYGFPDGPRCQQPPLNNAIKYYLWNLEAFFYRSMPKADMCLCLRPSQSIIIERNRSRNKLFKESDSEIIERFNKSLSISPISHEIIEVENNGSNLNEYLLKIDSIVWNYLSSCSL